MEDAIRRMNEGVCPICHLQHDRGLYRNPMYTRTGQLRCARCGSFDITLEALMVVDQLWDDARPIISRWISDQNHMCDIPVLTDQLLTQLSETSPLRFSDKARRLLQYAAEKTSSFGQGIRVWEPELASHVETFDEKQIGFIADYLVDQGWFSPKDHPTPGLFMLTGDGLVKAEELQSVAAKSSQGFVAMRFDDSMTDAWLKGFYPALDKAGYVPMRIDNKEHTNKICDEIIVEIRRSRFLVADFTGQRQGVYYEAGFAMGLPIQVIWTCRNDEREGLHFEIRQYNCIFWQTTDDLRTRLYNRVVAIIGDGPRKQLQ